MELQSSVCLDGIVTVVDAVNLRRQLIDVRPSGAVNEAERQIAYADVILLNKVSCRPFGVQTVVASVAMLRKLHMPFTFHKG